MLATILPIAKNKRAHLCPFFTLIFFALNIIICKTTLEYVLDFSLRNPKSLKQHFVAACFGKIGLLAFNWTLFRFLNGKYLTKNSIDNK